MLISLTMPLSGSIETVWVCHILSYLSLACFACCLAICRYLRQMLSTFSLVLLCCNESLLSAENLAASLNAFCK